MNHAEANSQVRIRVSTIRVRTWSCTLLILVGIIFYFLVSVGFGTKVNYIDLVFMAAITISTHCLYFPDGDLFGQRDPLYQANRLAYNQKATAINSNRKTSELRDFCKIEHQERKNKYIETECGSIGISTQELDEMRELSPKQVKKIRRFDFKSGKCAFFTKRARKTLYKILFNKFRIEENKPSVILSAVDNEFTSAIHDEGETFRKKMYFRRIFRSTILAVFLAYITFNARDGITFPLIARIAVYVISIVITAVFSFSQGERCSKVFKNAFYVDLCIFIDGFFEWLYKEKQIDIKA